jgi:hydroxyacylglutathione hydrolase
MQLTSSAGTGKGNNYAYLVSDEKSRDAAIIDPANPPEYAPRTLLRVSLELELMIGRVLPVLQEQTGSGAVNLKSIINTHQ